MNGKKREIPLNSLLRQNDPIGDIGRKMLRVFVVENVRVSDVFASCASCTYFREENKFCAKYEQHPPAIVIVNSCIEGYSDVEEIPF